MEPRCAVAAACGSAFGQSAEPLKPVWLPTHARALAPITLHMFTLRDSVREDTSQAVMNLILMLGDCLLFDGLGSHAPRLLTPIARSRA